MRILIHSPAFLPNLGGLEINTENLGQGLTELGDSVVVVTRTPSAEPDREPFSVLRRPSPTQLIRTTRWADVVLHQNLSLRGIWPLLMVRRPLVIAHHSWYRRTDGRVAWQDRVKRAVVARASGSISVSAAIARGLGSPSTIVPNGYRDDLFHRDDSTPRDRELLFVGRLVSDKGADLILEALARLAGSGVRPGLSVVGDGPERAMLEQRARELGLTGRVDFRGLLRDEDLAVEYRRHRVLLVPSRYDEPFGIVALEGIASGCFVVASAGGGLADAVGPCGTTFPNGDVAVLADAIARSLVDQVAVEQARAAAPGHLARHRRSAMVAAYRAVLERAVTSHRAGARPEREVHG